MYKQDIITCIAALHVKRANGLGELACVPWSSRDCSVQLLLSTLASASLRLCLHPKCKTGLITYRSFLRMFLIYESQVLLWQTVSNVRNHLPMDLPGSEQL